MRIRGRHSSGQARLLLSCQQHSSDYGSSALLKSPKRMMAIEENKKSDNGRRKSQSFQSRGRKENLEFLKVLTSPGFEQERWQQLCWWWLASIRHSLNTVVKPCSLFPVSQQPSEVPINILLLQMRTSKPGEIKTLTQSYPSKTVKLEFELRDFAFRILHWGLWR